MENLTNDQIDKKIEIELKKQELEQKYGASFGHTNHALPPELESQWLNHIEQFEKQFEKHETIELWDFIGKPSLRNENEINEDEISDELDHLMDLLNEHNIVLSTLCPVDERELYRFITEELFVYQMDNIRIKGMNNCFIYEDFYPNAELDIRQAYENFFCSTMGKMKSIDGKGYDLTYLDTRNYKDENGVILTESQVINSISTLLNAFDYFEFISNKIERVSINEDKTDAELTFDIDYKGCFNHSSEFIRFKGIGHFRLKPSEYGGWDIYNIHLPGLKI